MNYDNIASKKSNPLVQIIIALNLRIN